MNKAELINVISEKVGLTKKQAEDMVDCFVDTVIETLKRDGEVTIAGFGQFMAKTRAGRTGVNPQNPTQKIQIPPVRVPKFKAGKRLKDELKGRGETQAAPSAPEETPAPETSSEAPMM